MRVTRRVLVNALAFFVLASMLFFLLAVQILPTVFGKTYTIYGIFNHAGGVFTNQEVTYRGVQVGRVGEMELTENAVKIEMIIEAKWRIPKQDARARILYKSAVGEQFIDILPERTGAPFLTDGDVIENDRTTIPIQTEDLLRELSAVLESLDPTALSTLVHELGTGLRGHGPDLKNLLLAIDTLSAIGAARDAEIALGLSSGADVQSAFNASREDFVAAAGSLAEVADSLAKRRLEFERTLDASQVLDREILRLLQSRRAQIEQLVADVAQLTRITHNQLDDVDLVLRYLGPFLNEVYRAYAAPYFMFNLIQNAENPSCSYTTSSRRGTPPAPRPIKESDLNSSDPKQPETGFVC